MRNDMRSHDRAWPVVCRHRINTLTLAGWRLLLAGLLLAVGLPPATAPGQGPAAGGRPRRQALPEGEIEARRMLTRAQALIAAHETERGVRMLEAVVEQFPTSHARFDAWLALGRHSLEARDQRQAIHYLTRLRELETDGENPVLTAEDRERVLEALYLTGVAWFQMRQYSAAFPVLRQITTRHPNTLWANQAYYYIGLSHFAQQNWGQAIEALGRVGTFVDPESPTVDLVEAGRRFYVKVQDADLPVLVNLGRDVTVTLATAGGDRETIRCEALTPGSDIFIGSIPTTIGAATPGDGTLQLRGGDTISSHYVDENTEDGRTGITRETRTRAVGTAAMDFTLGDYETLATAAFLEQPLFIRLQDVDLDRTPAADTVTVRVIARYKDETQEEPDDAGQASALERFMRAGEIRWRTRAETTVTLTEQGAAAPVHTGLFTGELNLRLPGAPAAAGVLTAEIGDEIAVLYEDTLHIGGEVARPVEATLSVSGQFDNRPRASQDMVFDPGVRSRKNLVEASAFLELGRIFRGMGLRDGAREKVNDGLARVEQVIRDRDDVPSALRQEAFKLKWELHLIVDDYTQAIVTCTLFNRLYPDSPFVDQALMGIANAYLERGDLQDALRIYGQVLALGQSNAKPEAQFRIAQVTGQAQGTGSTATLEAYRRCAERYPESPFAGKSLAVIVDYHIETGDYTQADIMLEHIFQDYPDADFLDSLLLKWVLVAFRQQAFAKAHEKGRRLIVDYPESPFAERAKQIMPRIEARLGTSAGAEGTE